MQFVMTVSCARRSGYETGPGTPTRPLVLELSDLSRQVLKIQAQ